jgi:hypothetical protein
VLELIRLRRARRRSAGLITGQVADLQVRIERACSRRLLPSGFGVQGACLRGLLLAYGFGLSGLVSAGFTLTCGFGVSGLISAGLALILRFGFSGLVLSSWRWPTDAG